jgi:lysozyme family protein
MRFQKVNGPYLEDSNARFNPQSEQRLEVMSTGAVSNEVGCGALFDLGS